jgi:hypothetical protein
MYSKTDVAFDAEGGIGIGAWLFMPERSGPHPAITMAHGYAGTKEHGIDPFAKVYPRMSWDKDALVHPEGRALFAKLLKKGWTDALRELDLTSPCLRSGRIGETATNGTPVSA